MPFLFFWISALNSEDEAARLNDAVRSHRVVAVEKHFCSAPNPGWAICVEFIDGDGSASASSRKSRGVDYREILDEATFRIFSRLRDVRRRFPLKTERRPTSLLQMNSLQLSPSAGVRLLPTCWLSAASARHAHANTVRGSCSASATVRPQSLREAALEASRIPIAPDCGSRESIKRLLEGVAR